MILSPQGPSNMFGTEMMPILARVPEQKKPSPPQCLLIVNSSGTWKRSHEQTLVFGKAVNLAPSLLTIRLQFCMVYAD